MNHFTIWDWADFSRGVADEKTSAAMQAHLSSGCSRCERTVRVLSGVTAMARGEAQYEPPARQDIEVQSRKGGHPGAAHESKSDRRAEPDPRRA